MIFRLDIFSVMERTQFHSAPLFPAPIVPRQGATRTPGSQSCIPHASHGLMTHIPAASKGAVSRDATMKPREAAIAAM